ncbi:phage shock protein C (PspC) family protein [Microterricola gilva]|uniref:Phage shock protein C (PspC) family protein n=1 Tax=Microterricola gilva TaxID=393267 RepID=A0A4V2GB35_9MICO|nr:PspC domain-containing protein [Microterricola gilva]RZU66616.1 phage shock protein C (PspC) family protein [Microterricola gilva]
MKHDLPADLDADAAAGTAAGAASDTTDGGPAAPDFPAYSSSSDRDQHGGAPHGFFAWLRSLGVQRQPGWIGGVASGIAARIGIDPIIVRGILVVLAIFAAPVLLFYGIAWLLLPDSDGRIHLQRLLNGDPQPALAGIAIFVLLGLMTPLNAAAQSVLAGNFWTTGGWFWGWSGSSVIATIFNIAALAAITVFVVWLVRRSNANSRGGGAPAPTTLAGYSTAPATDGGGIRSGDSDAAATTMGDAAAGAAAGAAAESAAAVSAASATAPAGPLPTAEYEPVPPGAGASVDELAAWKLQHEAWRIERERFNRAQADADRAARSQWAAENKARSQAFAVQAAEHRRLRKLERPRTSAAAVFFTLGAALVAGAGSAIAAMGTPENADYAATIGVLVAALVASFAMIIAGIARRRSGFIAAVTMTLLLIGLVSATLPRNSEFLWPGQMIDNGYGNRTVTQPWGDLTIWVHDGNDLGIDPNVLSVTKANGDIYIRMDEDSSLSLTTSLSAGHTITVSSTGDGVNIPPEVIHAQVSGTNRLELGTIGPGAPADLILDASLSNGDIFIWQHVEAGSN